MKTNTNTTQFTGNHRWTFGDVHTCELCKAVALDIDAVEPCKASDEDRADFDSRFSPAEEYSAPIRALAMHLDCPQTSARNVNAF